LQKNFNKTKKLTKYKRKIQTHPKFRKGVSNNVGWTHKKDKEKNKK
jgi:hypothetical protein